MPRVANKRIAFKAMALDRQRRRKFSKVDMGGGGSRIGGRVSAPPRPSKSELLRPNHA